MFMSKSASQPWGFSGRTVPPPADGASHPPFNRSGSLLANGEDARRTTSNTIEIGSVVIVKLLCKRPFVLVLRERRMGGDSNPRCLSAHTLSRRAQSTTLSPIQNDLPLPLNLSLGSMKVIN